MYKAERMDNFPGMPSVSGREMVAVFRTRLEESGAELIAGRALSVVPMGGASALRWQTTFTSRAP